MVVGPVQLRARKALDQPVEQRLVAGVHAQRDLRLLAVAAERPLADQQADQHAAVECDSRSRVVYHGRSRICFTVAEKRETTAAHGATRR